MDIRTISARKLGRMIREKKISSPEATELFLGAIKREDEEINAYISVFEDGAMQQAKAVQSRIDRGESAGLLDGVPVAVKDNICIAGTRTTAASRMLENFIPPYDAHIMESMNRAGAVVLGKTNLDEFAMGASTETSFFGTTKNPWDLARVPGGSSGGNAAAVAAGLAPYAIGSDTGGSIRQPCAFCNLTGIKPTYGSVSRYGIMAYASSLDQAGPMGKDVWDCAEVLTMLSGKDPRDSTSIMERPFDFSEIMATDPEAAEDGGGKPNGGNAAGTAGGPAGRGGTPLSGMRIGLPKNYFEQGVSSDVQTAIFAAAEDLRKLGATVEECEIPLIEFAVPSFYIIACAEASSNLSRFDGIKFGYRSKNATDIVETYYKSRSEGFGTEVKRRIMLGSFVLSSGYFDAYYKKALQVRSLITGSFSKALSTYDMILSPVSPTVSYPIGRQDVDPVATYLADIYTVSVNLAGLPALALPCGFDPDGMPVGMQLIGKAFSECNLLRAGAAYQTATDHHKKRPPNPAGSTQPERKEANA